MVPIAAICEGEGVGGGKIEADGEGEGVGVGKIDGTVEVSDEVETKDKGAILRRGCFDRRWGGGQRSSPVWLAKSLHSQELRLVQTPPHGKALGYIKHRHAAAGIPATSVILFSVFFVGDARSFCSFCGPGPVGGGHLISSASPARTWHCRDCPVVATPA